MQKGHQQFNKPFGIDVDAFGNLLYIGDGFIGNVTTFAGSAD